MEPAEVKSFRKIHFAQFGSNEEALSNLQELFVLSEDTVHLQRVQSQLTEVVGDDGGGAREVRLDLQIDTTSTIPLKLRAHPAFIENNKDSGKGRICRTHHT